MELDYTKYCEKNQYGIDEGFNKVYEFMSSNCWAMVITTGGVRETMFYIFTCSIATSVEQDAKRCHIVEKKPLQFILLNNNKSFKIELYMKKNDRYRIEAFYDNLTKVFTFKFFEHNNSQLL